MHDAGGNPPVTLDYAPPPPWWRRRFVTGGILAVTCAIAFATWYWGPALRNHFTFRYCQWLCLPYSAPPDQVVYESDPALVKGLLTQPGYITPHFRPGGGGSGYTGPPLIDPAKAVYRPGIWDEFVAITGLRLPFANPSQPVRTAICFMGELKTPSGKPRLVMVECYPLTLRGIDPSSRWANATMRSISVDHRATISTPMNLMETSLKYLLIQGEGTPNLRVFAGQRDPADASRFTIRYEVFGQEGFVDGAVDDAGLVRIQLREPFPQGKMTPMPPYP